MVSLTEFILSHSDSVIIQAYAREKLTGIKQDAICMSEKLFNLLLADYRELIRHSLIDDKGRKYPITMWGYNVYTSEKLRDYEFCVGNHDEFDKITSAMRV
jgi:hypothetical protein